MRFPRTFSRSVGEKGATKPLAAEEAPALDRLGETEAAAALNGDNVLVSRQANTMGWPAQRIAAAWIPPTGPFPEGSTTANALDFEAFIFDHQSGVWLRMSSALAVPPRTVFTLDCVVLLDVPTAGRRGGQVSGPQTIEVMLVPRPISNGKRVDQSYRKGSYVFVMGADVSSTP